WGVGSRGAGPDWRQTYSLFPTPYSLKSNPETGEMTSNARHDPVALAQALIRCRSVTPEEGGALTWLAGQLEPAGFTCHRLTMTESGTPDVQNLYARLG